MSEFQIEGLDPILKKLKGLSSDKFRLKAVRAAGTKAMRIVRDAARVGAQGWDDPATNTKPIYKRIVTRNDAKGGKRIGGVVIKVGVEGGAKLSKDPESAAHWRLQELGWSGHAARPVLRPALERNVGKVTETFVTALNTEIDKIVAKGG